MIKFKATDKWYEYAAKLEEGCDMTAGVPMTDELKLFPVDDMTELLQRITLYSEVYRAARLKAPLFRLTPYEHKLFLGYLSKNMMFIPEYWGDLPKFMDVNFELVGKPVLFNGEHFRSDSGFKI